MTFPVQRVGMLNKKFKPSVPLMLPNIVSGICQAIVPRLYGPALRGSLSATFEASRPTAKREEQATISLTSRTRSIPQTYGSYRSLLQDFPRGVSSAMIHRDTIQPGSHET